MVPGPSTDIAMGADKRGAGDGFRFSGEDS